MFYVLLAAIPLTAAATVASFARLVDGSAGENGARLARTQSIALALALAAVVLAAAAASPLS